MGGAFIERTDTPQYLIHPFQVGPRHTTRSGHAAPPEILPGEDSPQALLGLSHNLYICIYISEFTKIKKGVQ